MKNYFKFLIFINFFTFFGEEIFSQYTNIEKFTIENGLSQNSINCIIQDKKGFLWIGTEDGLNRYDGYKFKYYRHNASDENSISSNFIHSIYEENENILWICTEYGLNKYNRKEDKFTRFVNLKNHENSIHHNNVFYIYKDKKEENIFWVKTFLGLEKFDLKKKQFTLFEPEKDIFTTEVDYNNFSIIEDKKQGLLWFATKYGLTFFNKNYGQFKRFTNYRLFSKSISSNHIRAIYEDSDTNLWIATESGLNLKSKRNTFKSYFFDRKNLKSAENTVNVIIESHNKKELWIGTDVGLKLFDKEKRKFISTGNININDRILTIMEDKSNILWVGTNNCLYKVDTKKSKFILYRKEKNGSPNFTSNDIRTIYEDKNKNIWIGTNDNGLNIFNRKTNGVTHYTTKHYKNKIISNKVTKIYEDKKGRIWLSTALGTYIYDEYNRIFTPIEEVLKATENKIKNVNAILEDAKGYFWIGTKNRLFRYKDNFIETFEYSNIYETNISSNVIYSLLEDKDGDIWIGTSESLEKFNPETRTFKHYNHINTNLSRGSVLSLLETKDGIIWIGTESGLNKFDKKNNTFKVFTEKDGLENDFIYEILEDKKSNLWLSTNRGISKFNTKTEKIINYGLKDGLQSYEFNARSVFKSKTGEFFFGGLNGFNSFFPDSIEKIQNKFKPNVIITSFSKMNEKGKSEIWKDGLKEININYDDFNIIIEFSALEFTHPKKNHYKYKLEAYDKDWLEIGTQNYANYSKLPYGDGYVFRVKASNNDLVWSEKEFNFRIIVKPFILKNNIAYGIYSVLFIIAVASFIIKREQNLQKENEVLKRQKEDSKKIKKQKEELSIKNKSITDSINYAKTIIEGLLPSIRFFKNLLPNSFILNMPKDIVSGDFYWIHKKNKKVFFAAVDCTGHGVPGAFMSIIGLDLLRNIINKKNIKHPNQILTSLNEGLRKTLVENVEKENLDKNQNERMVNDGMDLALCMIDLENMVLEYAGAINPLYMIRDKKLDIIKGNRFSLGQDEHNRDQVFINKKLKIQKNDVFYIFSDGYIDQFGGKDGKKFKRGKFKKVLLKLHHLNINEQKDILKEIILKWKDNLEQVDDILVIGWKI